MKKLIILTLLLTFSCFCFAQTAASYLFTAFTGTYSSIAATGTPIPHLIADDSTVVGIPIGFNFSYCGLNYTQLSICSNGFIVLGTCTSTTYNNAIGGEPCGGVGTLMTYFDDLWGSNPSCTPSTSGAYYTTIGTAPNRMFIAEWKDFNCYAYTGVTTCSKLNMQVILYESTNVIDFVYGGGVTLTGMTATIGLMNSSGDFQTLTNNSAAPTATSTSFISTIASAPANNQVYRWTPCGNRITPILATSTTLCAGSSYFLTLSDTSTGGTWSSLNTGIATISGAGTTGTVTGVAGGLDTIRYSLNANCYADTTIFVPRTGPITGTLSLCPGFTSTLTDTSLGTWTGGTAGIATISPTGVVSGLAVGTTTVTFTSSTYSCSITAVVTVNALPAAITGASVLCAQSTITLADATLGGTWSSNNTAIATAIAASGVITGVSGGHDTIVYATTGVGCNQIKIITVNPLPSAITGGSSVCIGSHLSLSDLTPGGTWSSSNIAIATVIPATGVVSGVSAGTAVITYTLPTGCLVTITVTVVGLPGAITGTFVGCQGSSTTLSDATAGGTWSSSNAGVATINSGTGSLTGSSAGTSTITYTVGTGCFVTAGVTVNPLPNAISGSTSICAGSSLVLTDATPVGTWSSSNTAVATINSGTGNGGGVSAGTANISYTLATGCGVGVTVTVNTQPAAITGTLILCNGSTTTLSNVTSGGTWTSAVPAVATVTATGVVSGASVGTSTITYAIGSCFSTAVVTVNIQPAVITGTLGICNSSTSLLNDITPSGTWSSITTGVATISGIGLVTGVSVGTSVISYTLGSCAATAIVTVSALPFAGTISGTTNVCVGSNITLTDGAAGGTWSSLFPALATVSASGTVFGVSNGIDTIKYTVTNGCGTAVAVYPVTVNNAASAAAISGAPNVCLGSSITLADVTAGGIWTATNTNASVSLSGVVTGLAVGTDLISYSITNICGTAVATYNVTVNVSANSGSISGPTTICAGSFTLFSDSAAGGTWSGANGNAFVNSASGLVTGLLAGVDTISYTVVNACGPVSAIKILTITPLPASAPITGLTNVCIGAHTTLADAIVGGAWSVTNSHATIGATGIVTGVSAGTDTIVYTLSTSCGTIFDSLITTINPIPNAGTISGPSVVCMGSFITLADPAIGGIFSSTNFHATVIPSTGMITGISTGIDSIIYTVINSCGSATTQKVITVNPIPSTGIISGATSICVGATTPLTESISGGTWSVANANASITSITGLLTGLHAGTDSVYYSLVTSCGTSVDTFVITINPLPSADTLAGSNTVCVGSANILTPEIAGGTWSASNANATISGGIVTGVSLGIDIISYTVTTLCGTGTVTKTITINPFPSAGVITGSVNVCAGNTITLNETIPGGSWSSSSSLATISATGVVTGVSGGTDTISYTITNSCGTVGTFHSVIVNTTIPAGTLSGLPEVCIGSSIILIPSVPGGSWSAVNSHATVSAGTVLGVTLGTDTISYSFVNGCGVSAAVLPVSVETLPTVSAISSAGNVCVGSGITLIDATPGGIWSASNSNVTISSTGIVSGISVGLDTVYYNVINACGSAITNTIVSVNPIPLVAGIIGATDVCLSSIVTYTDATLGGQWYSSNTAVGTINISTGEMNGLTIGTTIISYTVTNSFGCPASATQAITVQIAPSISGITGTTHECIGSNTSLADATSGGAWSSSNTAIATVSTSGVVTGLSAGVVTISYAVADICGIAVETIQDTVVASPAIGAISGSTTGCIGTHVTLTDATAAGAWASSNGSIANINPTTGVVTGVTAGTVTITYVVVNTYGCSNFVNYGFTVEPSPVVSAISGVTNECIGGSQTLVDGTPGGVWSSSNTAIASINTIGKVHGNSAGIVTISYAVSGAFGCMGYATILDTVNTAPIATPISGTTQVCPGNITTLSNSTPLGIWSSLNSAIATVNATTGVVTGISTGTTTIYYTLITTCGTIIDSTSFIVHPIPTIAPINGPAITVCAGQSTVLTDSTTGGIWTSSNIAIATIGSTTGVAIGLSSGTVSLTYTVDVLGCSNSTNITITFGSTIGSSVMIPTGTATLCHGNDVDMHVASTATGLNYQWEINSNPIIGATDSTYLATVPGSYTVILGNGICQETISGLYISAQPNPVIAYSSPNVLYTGSFYHYQWFLDNVAIPGATNSVYFESAPGNYTVVATDINGCSDTSAVYALDMFGAGIKNINNVNNIRIYPNPASSVIYFDAPMAIKVKVVSPDGKLMNEVENTSEVNISQLSNGVYFIMVYDNSNVLLKTDKLMKMN